MSVANVSGIVVDVHSAEHLMDGCVLHLIHVYTYVYIIYTSSFQNQYAGKGKQYFPELMMAQMMVETQMERSPWNHQLQACTKIAVEK
jgi:hypothetical protein